MSNATMSSASFTNAWRSGSGRYAARLVHLNAGWRWWAFRIADGADQEAGFDPNGYGTLDEVRAVAANIQALEAFGANDAA